ncbi:DUF4221 family protein [Maribacter sp. 2304DJ31-5]|uniref:DUF4221 family protein n=1 Tax=Maribacter sp. 2304DJ31-5 TaxID=3386273 RepID=UPI0039BCF0EF
MKFRFLVIIAVGLLASCNTKTIEINNPNKGKLHATKTLKLVETKKILLDADTAPKPQYIQIFKDTSGIRNFTFLNRYTNSIYFYDYNSLEFIKKITYDKEGPDGILGPMGYHIKTLDSIYVYNMPFIELFLTNGKGQVLTKKSLAGSNNLKKSPWYYRYPQYYPRTVTPFLETPKKLLFTGQFMFSVPDSIINTFKLTANIDYNMNAIEFGHGYPKELYGHGYNWNDQILTDAFLELHPDGDKLIYSFPISHDVYITSLYSEGYQKMYAGSNEAGSISSIQKEIKKTNREILGRSILGQDLYGALKYDKYRKIYYRFICRAIPDATIHTSLEEKPVGIIIMDKDFKYLGETILGIGKEWNWQNSFVTEEGLNIEYLEEDDIDEVALILKIFTVKDI